MNKTIIIWVVIIIVVALGGYGAYSYMKSNAPATTENTNTPANDQVQAEEVVVGTGAEATPGSIVSVLYTGKLANGTTFDSSAMHNNEPLKFQLGTQDMIPGFQIGVNGMRVGGKRIMAVPPSLAYGSQAITNPETGAVVIPANSTVVFEVELVAVEPAPTTTAQ